MVWLPWSSSSSSSKNPALPTPTPPPSPSTSTLSMTSDLATLIQEKFTKARAHVDDFTAYVNNHSSSLPPSSFLLIGGVIGGVVTAGGQRVYTRYFRRIRNGLEVNNDMLAGKRWIKGYVTSVKDPDNFRLYHTPAFGWRWPLKFRRLPRTRYKDTISIRMAGVDAPELAHFGSEKQKYADESLAWLRGQVLNKFVYCQVFRRDQYSRIVAVPHRVPRYLPGWLATGQNLSLAMLRAGWAVVYEQTGAVYGPAGKESHERAQKEAQDARRGMWQDGLNVETPAEYKRRIRAAPAPEDVDEELDSVDEEPKPVRKKGWLSSLLHLGR